MMMGRPNKDSYKDSPWYTLLDNFFGKFTPDQSKAVGDLRTARAEAGDAAAAFSSGAAAAEAAAAEAKTATTTPKAKAWLKNLGYLSDEEIKTALSYTQEEWDLHDLTDMDADDFEKMVKEMALSTTLTAKFRKAVRDDYYFQMYYDDLPIWGFVGKIEKILKPGAPELRYYLFTHVHFDVAYNRDRVVEINVSTDPLRTVDITDGESVDVEFS